MKKIQRIMAMALVAMMLFTFPQNSLVTLSAEDAAATTKTKMATPTDVVVNDDLTVQFKGILPDHYYQIEMLDENGVYRGGDSWRRYDGEEGGIETNYDIQVYISETGRYSVVVQAYAPEDSEEYTDSDWSEPVYFDYVRPEEQLGTATGSWDPEEEGVFLYPAVEGAGSYDLDLYKYNEESGDWRWSSGFTGEKIAAGQTQGRFTGWKQIIQRKGEGKYVCTVSAKSSNPRVIANGEEGPMSDVYDTTSYIDKLTGIIENTEGTAETVVTTLKEQADMDKLQMAMQTNENFLDKVAELEEKYAAENGVAVSNSISAEAAQYVSAADTSCVGAAFSAGSGDLELKFDVTPEAERVPLLNNYEKSVQLDISLHTSDAKVDELKMPITITMKVPTGIDLAQLIIFHRLENGSTETVAFKDNGDGTITFTVKSFSTFVFAEKSTDTDEDDTPDVPDTDDESNAGSGSTSGNDNTASTLGGSANYMESFETMVAICEPNGVVTIGKEAGLTSLPNSFMKALLERGDVTLVFEYVYEGTEYRIVIPAGKAENNDIPYYGPLYLAAHYGNNVIPAAGGAAGTYTVKSGDTLSKIAYENGMTLKELAAKNPAISNVDLIYAGQRIFVK